MSTAEGTKLGKGNLGLLDVVAQAVGFIGPTFAAAFFIPTIAGASFTGKGAGIATPISILLAAVGMIGVGWIVSRFARRIHAAGSLYYYVTEAFGRPLGFLAGWIYYGGMLALTLGIGLAFGGFLSLTLEGNGHGHVDWYWLTIAFWVVAFAMQVFGVQISTRAQLALALVSMVIVFVFSVYVIFKGGTNGNSIDAFNPSKGGATGIFYGVLYAVIMFIGFETAANLAEETADPGRNVPRAVLYSVVVSAVFYVVVAYATLAGFGFDLGEMLKPENFPPIYGVAANPDLGGSSFGELVQWLVVIDIAAVALGTATGTSRGIFALARDGRLPKPLAYVHPRYKTPVASAALLAVGSIAWTLVVHGTDGLVTLTPNDPGEWFGAFQWGATLGGFLLVIVYLAVSATAFKGQPGSSFVGLALAGVVGAVTSVVALYGVIKGVPPIWAIDKVWWESAIWVAVGAVVLVGILMRGGFSTATAAEASTDP